MLKVYTLEQAEQWDKIVRSFNDYDVYWLSGYVKAFKIHGDGEPLLFYYKNEDTRGINVVMKRNISDVEHFKGFVEAEKYYDFSTPYGYGGWLIEGMQTEMLFQSYEKWCQKSNIISEFVRFHPMIKNQEECSDFYDVVKLGEVVHIDLSSPEIILENMVSSNRNKIRKAQKNNVKVYHGCFPEVYEKFYDIYIKTMNKDNADKYYYFNKEFYNSIMKDLPENAEVFYAQIPDGTVIASSIMLECNKKINYHLSGSLKDYNNLAPVNLLLYKTALWGCTHGFKTLYLGGGVGSAEDSLFEFKRSFFKGDLNRFYIGKKIFNEEKYNELLALRNEIENSDFFPKYRG